MARTLRILVVSHLSRPLVGMTPLHVSRILEFLAACGHEVDLVTIEPRGDHPVYARDAAAPQIVGAYSVRRTFPGPLYALAAFSHRSDSPAAASRSGARAHVLRRAYRLVGKQLLIPDRSVDWLPFALRAADEMDRARPYDVTVSVAHPVTSHLVSWALRRWRRRRWIGYYLDPWSFNPDVATLPRWRQRLDAGLEAAMLSDMDLVLVNTEETRAGYLAHFPRLRPEKVRVCGIGYDPGDYLGEAPPPGSSAFLLVYTGTFTERRNPAQLFMALERIGAMADIRLVVAGDVEQSLRQRFADSVRSGRLEFRGTLAHDDVVRLQRTAAALVLIGWTAGYQVPAKLYEYIGARRPILAIRGDSQDPAARLVELLHRGVVVDANVSSIEATLLAMYEKWRRGALDQDFDLVERPEYAWPSQIATLGAAVQEIADR